MRLSGIALLILFFYGCSKEKLKAPDAYFFRVNTVDVAVTTPSIQGTTSNKITDLWLYVNGNYRGAYPVGSLLPIACYGPAKIQIFPGIKNNGISATRQPYEFLAPVVIDTTLNDGNYVTRNLIFNYKNSAVFHWNEDFEGFGTITGISMRRSPYSGADTGFSVLNGNPNVFEGAKCILMSGMTGATDVAQIESNAQFTLPLSGAPVYLEINYKCNQPFEVGVYGNVEYKPVNIINTSYTWNKIYIQLTAAVSTVPLYAQYGIYLRAIHETDNPEIYIDNLKVISY